MPTGGRTDEQTLGEGVGSRTEEANVISMAHPSVQLRRMRAYVAVLGPVMHGF